MSNIARRLPAPCLLVLVGASASGKSTWAAEHVAAPQVVSSDALRGVVGEDERDLAASDDAFEVLDLIVARRVARRLTTVVDTTGLDAAARARWLAMAVEHGVPAVAVRFEVTAAELHRRNAARDRPVPRKIVDGQARAVRALTADDLLAEGFVEVLAPDPIRVVPPGLATPVVTATAAAAAAAEPDSPAAGPDTRLRFGLHISSFEGAGDDTADLGPALRRVARHAEDAGFDSLWVMDHFRQIPQAGRAWHDMPESWTTLSHLAAVTERIRIGPLVSGITYRNVGLLGKMAATLDVLSGGRVTCGVGAAWFEAEHRAYGYDFPSAGARLDLLEDALQALPLLWGSGSPAFEGAVIDLPEAMGYPRPLQDPIPILVGGGGERRTLRLAAQYADACNLFGEPDTVAHKIDVLRRHCADVGRDPGEVEVTTLGTVLVGRDGDESGDLVDRLRPDRMGTERYAAQVNAGTVDDHVARFERFAAVGVDTAIVSTPAVWEPDGLAGLTELITRFR